MDSGNSGSMQSSSGGGDEEYDSRSESISSFLNHSASAHFGSISDPQAQLPPPQLLSSHQHQPTLFNHPHSQNLDVFSQSLANHSGNNNQYSSNDMVWSRGGLRSAAHNNHANFGNITALSSSSSTQSVFNVQGLNQSMPSQSVEVNAAKASGQSDQPNMVKNPKKRTRASRRAPTTVLTTDTTNFRQMVQEFTGIPAAPFSGSPYSRRLDLFSTGTSNMRSGHLDSLGPLYPLRPSAQKVQLSQSPLLNSSSMIDSLVSSTSNTAGNAVLPSSHDHHLGLSKQSQNILNMQNQMLSFQGNNDNNTSSSVPSFLQHPSLKHPSSMLTGKSQGINTSVPSFDELGLGHHHENVSGFPSSERWRDHGGGGGGGLNGGSPHDHNNLGSSFDGSKQHHLSNYKFNCSASSSEFHNHDKGLENLTSGGEGTVGSWICPSD